MLKKCKRLDVYAMGIDKDGAVAVTRNGNEDECLDMPGKCGCKHAEALLLEIMKRPVSVTVSHSPCISCAQKLVYAGVKEVKYFHCYRLDEGLKFLVRSGITVEQIGGRI